MSHSINFRQPIIRGQALSKQSQPVKRAVNKVSKAVGPSPPITITAPLGSIRLTDAVDSYSCITSLASLKDSDFVPGVIVYRRRYDRVKRCLVTAPRAVRRREFKAALQIRREDLLREAMEAEEKARKAYMVTLRAPSMPKTSIAPRDVLRHFRRTSKAFLIRKVRSLFGAPRRHRHRPATAAVPAPPPPPPSPFRCRKPRRRDDEAHRRAIDLLRDATEREERLFSHYDAQMNEFAGIKADLAEVRRLQQEHPEVLAGMTEEWLAQKSCRGRGRKYAEAEV